MTHSQYTTEYDRAGYIAGLRQLADLLEQHDDVPLPYTGTLAKLNWIIAAHDDQPATLAKLARLIPGDKAKEVYADTFSLSGRLAGLRVGVLAARSKVCERVVVGTETVVETAVTCVHCGVGIAQTDVGDWVHVADTGGMYLYCFRDETDATPATPPDFAGREVKREIVKWQCSPVLAAAASDGGR